MPPPAFFRAQKIPTQCPPLTVRYAAHPSALPPCRPPAPPRQTPLSSYSVPAPFGRSSAGGALRGAALPVCLLRSFCALPSRSAVARSARRRFGLAAGAAPPPRCDVAARGSLRSAAVALLPCPSGWRSSLPPGSRLVAPARSVASAPFPLVAPLRARGCVACGCAAALLARTAV